ncbi:DUF3850 domain-containing protein [Achromobacter sp.]|uniref:DUF3850 domain-containing protein n=1 Tax=Achromobacter sp. TaxID=134375 RepID=UPI0028AA284C|nr:DUF3850 domain-containing protein [Achromobacter sp.]
MNENNATQPLLTGDEMIACFKDAIRRAREQGLTDAGPHEYVAAGAVATLSKLRAPVADERAAEQTAPGRQYHLLKTDPKVFQAVLSGAKTFEIRLNDRGYAVGDVLGLRETRFTGAEMRAGAPLVYTGRECQRFVSHVLTGYGLADGWCCLSFDLPHAGGASAPVAGEAQPVAWAFNTPSRPYTVFTTKPDQDNLRRDKLIPLYAAPQASEAVRDAGITASEDHIRPDLDRGVPGSFQAFTHWVTNHPNDKIYVHSAHEGFLAGAEWCRQPSAALSAQPGAQKGCNCATCRPHSVEMRMILCGICGDKRCPHAADHRNECTGTVAQKNGPWQPIDTAPKDDVILLFGGLKKDGKVYAPHVNVGYWTEQFGWTCLVYSHQEFAHIEPTHWMPRPEFPKQHNDGGADA